MLKAFMDYRARVNAGNPVVSQRQEWLALAEHLSRDKDLTTRVSGQRARWVLLYGHPSERMWRARAYLKITR